MDGFLLVDKPAGMSSFAVVAKVRRILSETAGKRVKVGHTGTLDPFATGLLILVIGAYTKRAEQFSKLDKTYEAELTLGFTSTTGDPEGTLSKISAQKPSLKDIQKTLSSFIGQIQQTPPAFSAIKINGQRAYKLARAGHSLDMKPRQVTITSIEVINYEYPKLSISTSVSSGTYVRSLAQDIGHELGSGAYLSKLRRTKVGDYDISDAVSLKDLTAQAIHRRILANGQRSQSTA